MVNKELENLQVGDLVFVYYHSNTCIKAVQKITPSGLIKVDGLLFNNTDGYLRGRDKYFCQTHIEIATPEKIEDFKKRVYIKKTFSDFRDLKVEDISFEQAQEINRIFNNFISKEFECTFKTGGE